MSKASYPLKLTASVKAAAKREVPPVGDEMP